ncbi:MAG: indole-3-glycerol phosphate synthase TrpC [Acidimicrobiia bacterium]
MPTRLLGAILERKRSEIEERKRAGAVSVSVSPCAGPPDAGEDRFEAALRSPGISVIAEIKRYSPSKPSIRRDLNPTEVAVAFERGGAAAISVLTDGPGFGGSLEDIDKVRAASSLPILRKDFIIDVFQIHEASVRGASAVLLIATILDGSQLKELICAAESFGLAALVEVHTEDELERAIEAGARIVGVNNRDLDTFEVDPTTALRLATQIPKEIVSVAESGIKGPEQVAAACEAGYDAVLVGEGVLVADDISQAVRRLVEGGSECKGRPS